MKNIRLFAIIFLFNCGFSCAHNDSTFLKVNFLYGSKPAKHYKKSERRYFGGLHGGHVTIELDSIDYGFGPNAKVHIFAHKKNFHGAFEKQNTNGALLFHSEEKYAIIYIPISNGQNEKAKQIFEKYLQKTPYDYAFFGMRCAAAANDVLGQIGIVKKKNKFHYVCGTFYPKKLRKRLLKLAKKENHKIIKNEGKPSRKWEKD